MFNTLRYNEIRENEYAITIIPRGTPKEYIERIENGEAYGLHVGTIDLAGDLWVACGEDGEHLSYFSTLQEAKENLCLRNKKLSLKHRDKNFGISYNIV